MTQCEIILNHLEKYGSITSYEAFKLYGITRLSGRVYDMKADGFHIVSEYAKSENSKKSYVVYRLGAVA